MVGNFPLALGVRVAAGGDARRQARGGGSRVEAEAVGRGAASRQRIPGVFGGIAVEVAPHVDPAQCREAGEVFGADEGGSGFVDQREPGVEVAEEEERFGDAGFGRRQEGIPESRFGGAFGFLGAGIGGEDVDYGEAEALLREIDIQPANGVFGRRGGGAIPGVTIRYAASDEQRQTTPGVEYNGPGRQTLYATADANPNGGGAPIRDMDCMDCHNRPSHSYDLPERGMDKAMAAGLISSTLPFVKKKGVEILKVNYLSRDEASQNIPAAFVKYYQDTYPAIYAQRQGEITASGKEVLAVWNRNIFPEMKVTSGALPSTIEGTD